VAVGYFTGEWQTMLLLMFGRVVSVFMRETVRRRRSKNGETARTDNGCAGSLPLYITFKKPVFFIERLFLRFLFRFIFFFQRAEAGKPRKKAKGSSRSQIRGKTIIFNRAERVR
jgi:hypothetical protein